MIDALGNRVRKLEHAMGTMNPYVSILIGLRLTPAELEARLAAEDKAIAKAKAEGRRVVVVHIGNKPPRHGAEERSAS